jgi:hypothetical protein
MRRFFLGLAIAVIGLALVGAAEAQGPKGRQAPNKLRKKKNGPDLVIKKVDDAGFKARVLVKNQGNRAAESSRLSMRIFHKGKLKGTRSVIVPPIPAGGSRTVTLTTNPVRVGVPGTRLELEIDSTNVVFERNENNNRFVEVDP